MHVIQARNVNQAYKKGIDLMMHIGVGEVSRNGGVLVSPSPVTTVYERPTERVLFDEVRDANPFFHLFECVWMLAGSNDTRFLDIFVKDFGSRYAEPGTSTMYAAYGHRWRRHFDVDQLDVVVRRLERNPADRRVVVSMWDPDTDLFGPDDIDPETNKAIWLDDPEPRDVPCNTHVYLRLRDITYQEPPVSDENSATWEDRIVRGDTKVLDIMVNCRSNDIIWGAYGANAVHFSVLQEYVAARLGVAVGTMYQNSWNWHAYSETWDKMTRNWDPKNVPLDPYLQPYAGVRVQPLRMFDQPAQALRDVQRFMEWTSDHESKPFPIFANRWFAETAVPMFRSHFMWRSGDRLAARRNLDGVSSPDWRLAAMKWMSRRMDK